VQPEPVRSHPTRTTPVGRKSSATRREGTSGDQRKGRYHGATTTRPAKRLARPASKNYSKANGVERILVPAETRSTIRPNRQRSQAASRKRSSVFLAGGYGRDTSFKQFAIRPALGWTRSRSFPPHVDEGTYRAPEGTRALALFGGSTGRRNGPNIDTPQNKEVRRGVREGIQTPCGEATQFQGPTDAAQADRDIRVKKIGG